MAKLSELKGFCYPVSPEGKASLLGNFPWHYGTEYLNIAYHADPAAIEKWLPEPLTLSKVNPDMAYVAFSNWTSVWDDHKDLYWENPERCQYKEAAVWVNCNYEGMEAQMCLPIWVNNDFTMARGWMMGFPKKLGQVSITELNAYNPGLPKEGPGAKITGTVASHGERLIKGTITIERAGTMADLPKPMGLPLIHLRHFPSLVPGAKPSVCELVKLGATNKQADPVVWVGKGDLEFYPSDLEEHMPLGPVSKDAIVGAYWFRNGYTFDGAEILHDYTKDWE